MEKIDFVLPWVDGSDPAWQKEREMYTRKDTIGRMPGAGGISGEGSGKGNEACRYRDMGTLRYVFRSMEKHANWFNKVYFLTWGHVPAWLNTENKRLQIVRHRDYIPEAYLPTFSSHVIELNLHRIADLSEKFVFFNDDTVLLQPVDEADFFQNGLPVDSAVQTVLPMNTSGEFEHILLNDLQALNRNFSKKNCIAENRRKWFTGAYGKKVFKNLYLQPICYFTGFEDLHIPYAYKKSVLEEVWQKEGEILHATSQRRFRSGKDVNQYLFRYWQFATGQFEPGDPERGRKFELGEDDAVIRAAFQQKKYKMVCLNDSMPEEGFEKEKAFIKELLEKEFPEKSSFEI